MAIEMFLKIVPVAKGRPRFSRNGHTYTPSNTRTAEKELKTLLRSKYQGKPMLEPIDLELQFFLPKGKTVKRTYPVTKPDLDNLVKLLSDSANGILWKDDSQICRLSAEKYYGSGSSIGIKLTVIPFCHGVDDAIE